MTKISPISRFTINGHSMLPTFKPGQDILSFNWAYLGKAPQVGDVIVFKFNDQDLIKRVQKVEGEQVLVEGDNQDDSLEIGSVNKSQIIGKVVYGHNDIPCPACGGPVPGVYGRKDAICGNCGFKLTCCGEP
jgi:phage repressor protein C with HTH and peptisase S24 domain